MKNQILDEIIESDFHRQLKKNEKIIWEGSPRRAIDFSLVQRDAALSSRIGRLGGLLIYGFLFFIFFLIFPVLRIILIITFLALAFIPEIFRWYRKKKTKYIISNERILFQIWSDWTTRYYFIPFSEINNFVVNYETKIDGIIHLAVKHPHKIPFDTYNLNSGERRHQPTLEMIENVKEVAKYITLGIQGKL